MALNFERNLIVTCSDDGTSMSYKIEMDALKQMARALAAAEPGVPPPAPTAFNYPPVTGGLTETSFLEKVDLNDETPADIPNPEVYSIQQEKLQAEEDEKAKNAN